MEPAMRTDILHRRDDILKWIQERKPKAFMCRELQCRQSTLNGWLKRMGITYKGNQGNKGIRVDPKRLTAEELSKRRYITPHKLKTRLLEDGIFERRCNRCGLSEWMGHLIPIELHHKDGNRWNNEFPNLEILCPNCHALTPNHSGKATGSYTA